MFFTKADPNKVWTLRAVAELQSRERYRTAYAPGTFREKIYGPGQAWLRDDHPGAAYRQETR